MPCFPRAAVIYSSVAMANSLLLITPLEVFSFSWGYALVIWNPLHLEDVFSPSPAVHLSKQVLIVLFFLLF